jgi:hypothetical protein
MNPGLELHQGHPAGRDPREMTRDELRAAGHEPMSPLQAHRARCLDCCVGQANEVALCTVVGCPAWPFRMGTNPWRKPVSEGQRAAAKRSMEQINSRRRKADAISRGASSLEDGIPSLFATGSGAIRTSATTRVECISEAEFYREDRDGPKRQHVELRISVGSVGSAEAQSKPRQQGA